MKDVLVASENTRLRRNAEGAHMKVCQHVNRISARRHGVVRVVPTERCPDQL